MDEHLDDARDVLHRLNNAVAALRMQAAVSQSRTTDPATADELARMEVSADQVTEAARELGALLLGAPAAAPKPPAPPPSPPATDVPVVVVVDDDAVLRAVLTRLLTGQNYQVIAAHSAEEIDAWLAAGHAADLLICDVELPGHNGDWLVARVRERRPRLPVLLLTGHRETAAPEGVTLVHKPFLPADLVEAVARLLAAGRGAGGGARS